MKNLSEKILNKLKSADIYDAGTKRKIDWVAGGEKLKEIRLQNRMSQQELADKIGLDKDELNNIELGLAYPKRFYLIQMLNLAKNYDFDDFFNDFTISKEAFGFFDITLEVDEYQYLLKLVEREQQEQN